MDDANDVAKLLKLTRLDPRFSIGTYRFIDEIAELACAMVEQAQNETASNFGSEGFEDDALDEFDAFDGDGEDFASDDLDDAIDDAFAEDPGHVTAELFCRVTVAYATAQYGMLARTTLAELGLRTTSDVGDAVYHMIDAGLMAKTESDRREDFDDLFDLGEELDSAFSFDYGKKGR